MAKNYHVLGSSLHSGILHALDAQVTCLSCCVRVGIPAYMQETVMRTTRNT